jgi:cell division protein ZapA
MENVQVEIFGQLYSLKGKDDPVYIRELAAYVDGKMREVQKGTGTGDPHRVAILTALTISDELYRLRQEHGVLGRSVEEGIQRLLDVTTPQASAGQAK